MANFVTFEFSELSGLEEYGEAAYITVLRDEFEAALLVCKSVLTS